MMKILLTVALLAEYALGALFDGPKCSYQTASLKIDTTQANIINYGGIKWDSGLGCWSNLFSCGSTRFQGSFVKKWKNIFNGNEYEETFTYATEVKRCVPDAVCNALAGGENECNYAAYTYEKWRPRSCNEAEDFNAITEDHDLKLYFTCCNTPNYCNKVIDYESATCGEKPAFSSYMVDLNTCWNTAKYDFMKDLLCDNNGVANNDILSYGDNCTNSDGSWPVKSRTKRGCRYKVTCADELRQKLSEYASCACDAADKNGYTGEFIAAAMEVNWNKFCPGVEIECAANGITKLIYKYWRARYKFRVAVAKAVVTEAIKNKIKEKIAERLNVDPERIDITADDATTTRRRLVDAYYYDIDISADDKATSNYFKQQLTANNADIQNDISTELNGATVDDTSVPLVEETEDKKEGTYTGDATKNNGNGNGENGCGNKYIMYGVIVSMIFAFIQ